MYKMQLTTDSVYVCIVCIFVEINKQTEHSNFLMSSFVSTLEHKLHVGDDSENCGVLNCYGIVLWDKMYIFCSDKIS